MNALNALLPLLIAMAAGYFATRRGIFRRDDMATLGRFVVTFAVPALLTLSLATRDPAEIAQWTYLAAYALAGVATFGVGLLYSRLVTGTRGVAMLFDGMGGASPNSGFVGYAVLQSVMPQQAGLVLGMNMAVENLVTIPLVLFCVEHTKASATGEHSSTLAQVGHSLGRVLRNPMLLAIVVGEALAIAHVSLPGFVRTSLSMFATSATAVALFSIGGTLVGLRPHGHLSRVGGTTLLKLAGMPLLAWVALTALLALGLPPLGVDLHRALLLSAAMPPFTTYAVIAAQHGEDEVPPSVLVVATCLSFLTILALLTWL